MQSGLMNTYEHPVSNRSWVAWALSALLFGAYVLLYFGPVPALGLRFDLLQRAAEALGAALSLPAVLRSKWILYGTVYTLAMIAGGAFFLRRHGNTPYQRLRTASVVGVQVVFAFLLPIVLQVFGHQEYYFTYFWPLKIEYFYPSVILAHPFLIVFWSFLGSLVAFPLLAYFLGKRFYCSWVCGCGGLANTFGEPFRHLSSKSTRAWSIEKVSIHGVLAAAVVTTAVVSLNWAVGKQHPAFAGFAFRVQEGYGFAIGAMFSGVLGVGLYPLMGTRVWCRFGCPMAALLGLAQKLGRFRIRVKKDMCIACGNCSTYCEMGIDVRAYAMANQSFTRASCVGCGLCAHVCPRGVLRLENRPVRWQAGQPIRVDAVDL
ncbi:MAG TPA: 4Fe-4S dicluster-binding protein [Vicinamibacteria bacterium]|nr:4Fe-4S dicluster-binding protein [Vicinamibacteria bacterium]